jgi:hypothetical protein
VRGSIPRGYSVPSSSAIAWPRSATLFAQRNAADYGAPGATDEDATLAIGDAERFIAAVEAWLAKRESGR